MFERLQTEERRPDTLAWLFSIAIALTLFSGNWQELGLPNLVSPDRVLLAVAFLAFLLTDPSLGRRPFVRLTPAHGVLLIAVAYALCAAVAAGTIDNLAAVYPLLDRFGLVPFLLFLVAPAVFAGERQRRILLGTFLVVGAYLGLIALFEGVGLRALVLPQYIVEAGDGIQAGRARGPFAAAAINGVALYFCAVAAGLAYITFAQAWIKRAALIIAVLCLFDLIFIQERSVWLGAILGTLLVCAVTPALRRYLVPIAAGLAAAVALALALIPGLHAQTTERLGSERTTWDRLNLNQAATNMVLDRPLFGFGPGTFRERSGPYFEQSAGYPLTNTKGEVHNVFLSTATELGLVGLAIWVLGLTLAVGGAIVVRGPPELYPWRMGLVAIAVMWFVVANLVPMVQAFPNDVLWLWAGVAWPWRYALAAAPQEAGPAPVGAPPAVAAR